MESVFWGVLSVVTLSRKIRIASPAKSGRQENTGEFFTGSWDRFMVWRAGKGVLPNLPPDRLVFPAFLAVFPWGMGTASVLFTLLPGLPWEMVSPALLRKTVTACEGTTGDSPSALFPETGVGDVTGLIWLWTGCLPTREGVAGVFG